MKFESGDFVSYKGEGWLITTIDKSNTPYVCDLINQYKEEKWNIDINNIILIAKLK